MFQKVRNLVKELQIVCASLIPRFIARVRARAKLNLSVFQAPDALLGVESRSVPEDFADAVEDALKLCAFTAEDHRPLVLGEGESNAKIGFATTRGATVEKYVSFRRDRRCLRTR